MRNFSLFLVVVTLTFWTSASMAVAFSQAHWDAAIPAGKITVYDLTTLLSEGQEKDLEWWLTDDNTGEEIPVWIDIQGNHSHMTPAEADIRLWTFTLNVKEVENPLAFDSASIDMSVGPEALIPRALFIPRKPSSGHR